MLRWHNETMNIWTHLFGVVLMLVLTVYTCWHLPPGAVLMDGVALSLSFACAGACFLASTLFHTHFCHSKWAFVKFGCLDYAGISTMICGQNSIVTYFAFYCHAAPRRTWIVLTVMMASVGILGPFYEKWSHRSFRRWRTLIYALSAVISASPVFHYLIAYGWPHGLTMQFYLLIASVIGWYMFGALLYATRTPERWMPGKCDIFGHSHQLWHVCIVLATISLYRATLLLLEWRTTTAKCSFII